MQVEVNYEYHVLTVEQTLGQAVQSNNSNYQLSITRLQANRRQRMQWSN